MVVLPPFGKRKSNRQNIDSIAIYLSSFLFAVFFSAAATIASKEPLIFNFGALLKERCLFDLVISEYNLFKEYNLFINLLWFLEVVWGNTAFR